MIACGFEQRELDHLRWLNVAPRPGDRLCMIGLPLVFLSPGVILVFSIGLTLALGRGGGALVLCTLASTLILWIAGTIALVVARGHMNSEFEKRNRIKLTYSLPREVETRYLKLLHWLEKMAPSEFFEIVQRDDGNFDFKEFT